MSSETSQLPPEGEPTVLDLYKSITKDWASFFNFLRALWDSARRAELHQALEMEAAQPQPQPEEPVRASSFPWRSVLALFTTIISYSLLSLVCAIIDDKHLPM